MTFGGICYFYTHFGEVNSILVFNRKQQFIAIRKSCCRSASSRRHLLDTSFLPRVQEPAAIRLRPRVFQTPLSYHTILKAVWKTGNE